MHHATPTPPPLSLSPQVAWRELLRSAQLLQRRAQRLEQDLETALPLLGAGAAAPAAAGQPVDSGAGAATPLTPAYGGALPVVAEEPTPPALAPAEGSTREMQTTESPAAALERRLEAAEAAYAREKEV